MKLLAARLCAVHRYGQNFVPEELTGLNVTVDNRNIHANYSARSKIEMSNLGISHHAFRKTDARAMRGEQGLGILLAEFVVERLGGRRDRVAFPRRRIAPAVNYYECKRPFFFRQRFILRIETFAPSVFLGVFARTGFVSCKGAKNSRPAANNRDSLSFVDRAAPSSARADAAS